MTYRHRRRKAFDETYQLDTLLHRADRHDERLEGRQLGEGLHVLDPLAGGPELKGSGAARDRTKRTIQIGGRSEFIQIQDFFQENF